MVVSRFRHTRSAASKPELQFSSVSSTGALWDGSNMISCNESYVAVPWVQNGSTAVFKHNDYGKVPANPSLLSGQGGAIIDLQFDPFNPRNLYTASEDGSICGWTLPQGGLTETCCEPKVRLRGHTRKCGSISFHPSASGVLASGGLDRNVRIWDVEKNESISCINSLEDYPMNVSWNLDGSSMCVTSRDKMINIIDTRTSKISFATHCHDNPRSLRCIWAKRVNMIITLGFNNSQARQIKVWDARNMTSPVSTIAVDQSSAAMLPSFDEDLSLLYLGSKGIGGIRSFELISGSLVPSHEFSATEPIKGMCMLPKWSLNQKTCEIARFYQLTQQNLFVVHMNLPRKNADDVFQKDVYPPTFSDTAALTSTEYANGERAAPLECDLEGLFYDQSKRVVAEDKVLKATKATCDAPLQSACTKQVHVDPQSDVAPPPKEKEKDEEDISGKAVLSGKTVHSDEQQRISTETRAAATDNKDSQKGMLLSRLKQQRAEIEEIQQLLATKIAELIETHEKIATLS